MSARLSMGLARAGEDLAAREYRSRGYQVIARNWRSARGEVDLVAARGNELVFCEVKTRSGLGFGLPEEAVSVSKQRKLRELAREFLQAARLAGWLGSDVEVRFDVVSVLVSRVGPPEVQVIEDAF